jgi:hypothetical protein
MSENLADAFGVVCDDCKNTTPILVRAENGNKYVCMSCLVNYTDDAKLIQQYIKSHYDTLLSDTGWK